MVHKTVELMYECSTWLNSHIKSYPMSIKTSANVKIGKTSPNKCLKAYQVAEQTGNLARKYRMVEQSERNTRIILNV